MALDGVSPIMTILPGRLRGEEWGQNIGELAWAPDGAAIYFELSVKFVSNLWRLHIDAGTLEAGSLVQLTGGAGQHVRMAVARDGQKVAFTTKAESIRIWSYKLDAVTGRITGSADPLTDPSMAVPAYAELAPDGRQLAYAITGVGTGRWELWTRDLLTGHAQLVARDNLNRFDPQWSRDGRRLAYHWGRQVEGHRSSRSTAFSTHPHATIRRAAMSRT